MPNVADEQATFISKANPLIPKNCCTSIAIAGYALSKLEQAVMTASMSDGSFPDASRACLAASIDISAKIDGSSLFLRSKIGCIISGSNIPFLSITYLFFIPEAL